MTNCGCVIPLGKTKQITTMQVLDKNGRPTGQILRVNKSVIDKIAEVLQPTKVSIH